MKVRTNDNDELSVKPKTRNSNFSDMAERIQNDYHFGSQPEFRTFEATAQALRYRSNLPFAGALGEIQLAVKGKISSNVFKRSLMYE